MFDEAESMPGLAIHEDQDREPWAAPRKVLREASALYFAGSPQSIFARAGFDEYRWRAARRRSRIYRLTMIRLREVGWYAGKQKEYIDMPEQVTETEVGEYPASTQMIRDAIAAKGLTGGEAAKAMGYSYSGFRSVFTGQRLVQTGRITDVAAGLGLDFDEFHAAVNRDRQILDKGLGQRGHKTYVPENDTAQANRRIVTDYLIYDMDFPRKRVMEVVPKQSEYSNEDIQSYVEVLAKG